MDRASDVRSVYSTGDYLKNNPQWHTQDSAWKAGHIKNMIDAHGLTLRSVAEVGCGAGEILARLETLLPSTREFHGYEPSQDAFALCLPKTNRRLRFHNASFPDVEEAFDMILAIDVVEHVEDCWGFLRRLASYGAYVIFHIPLDLSVQTVARKTTLSRAWEQVGHIHFFTKETALATLQDTGFRVIDFHFTCVNAELRSDTRKSELLKWPRRLLSALSPEIGARWLGRYSLLILAVPSQGLKA